MATKTNWEALKLEYLSGDIEDVAEFVRQRTGKETAKNGQAGRSTKGWAEDRAIFQKQIAENGKQKIIENPDIQKNVVDLVAAKQKVLSIVTKGLRDFEELIEFDQHATPIVNRNMQGLKVVWEMIKTELGEPTAVNKNMNENKDYSFADLLNALNNADTEESTPPIQS